ncbi:hypothetical protein D3C76_1219230 [compost metagenome]
MIASGAGGSQQPANDQHQAQADDRGGAHRTGLHTVPARNRLVAEVTFQRWPGAAHGRTIGAADTVELQADHLPVADTAGEQIEQDAEVQGPGNQRAVGGRGVHGRDFITDLRGLESRIKPDRHLAARRWIVLGKTHVSGLVDAFFQALVEGAVDRILPARGGTELCGQGDAIEVHAVDPEHLQGPLQTVAQHRVFADRVADFADQLQGAVDVGLIAELH